MQKNETADKRLVQMLNKSKWNGKKTVPIEIENVKETNDTQPMMMEKKKTDTLSSNAPKEWEEER